MFKMGIHSSRKLVCGVGMNDVVNGCKNNKEAYNAWKNMLCRAYSIKYHLNHPTYIGVTVSNEWLSFSSYLKWWNVNHIVGYAADKDILFSGNKIYSPQTVRYVPNYVNMVLVDRAASRGSLPIGVSNKGNRYQSLCNQLQTHDTSKRVNLGTFDTPEKAHQAWQIGKITAIERVIVKYRNEPNSLPEIIDALNQRIQILKDDIQAGLITIKL